MKKILKQAASLAIVVSPFMMIATNIAFAQTSQDAPLTLPDGLCSGGESNCQTIGKLSTSVAQFLLNDIAIPLTTIMVLVGAFQMITSSGNPEKVSKAQKTITYAAIGLVIAILASGIASIIQGFIGTS